LSGAVPGPAQDHPTPPATPFAAAVSGSSASISLIDLWMCRYMPPLSSGPAPERTEHPRSAATFATTTHRSRAVSAQPHGQAHRRSRRHRLAGTATVQAQTSLVRGASVQRLLLATAVHKRRRSTWSRQLKDAGEPSHRGARSQPVRGGVRGAGPLYGLQQPAVPGQLGDQRGDPGADGRPLVHPRAHSWHRLEPVSLSSAHLSAMSMPAARRTVQRSFATFQCVNVTKGLSSGPTRGRLWSVGGVRAVLACCCEMSCSCVCAVLCWCCRSPG